MARVTHVRKAQQRYATVPKIDPTTGEQMTVAVLRADGTPKTNKRGVPQVRRLTIEDKNQPLPNRSCEKCGTEIKVGDPYKWVKPKSGPYGGYKRFRCAACPTWTYGELSNSWAARISTATENWSVDGIESTDDAQAILDELAQAIRDLAEESREAAENVREGFGHDTVVSEEADQRADDLDSWADEIESTEVPDLPEPDETDCDECAGDGEVEDEDADVAEGEERPKVTCDECSGSGQVTPEDPTDEQMDEWRQEVEDAIQSALDNCPV